MSNQCEGGCALFDDCEGQVMLYAEYNNGRFCGHSFYCNKAAEDEREHGITLNVVKSRLKALGCDI